MKNLLWITLGISFSMVLSAMVSNEPFFPDQPISEPFLVIDELFMYGKSPLGLRSASEADEGAIVPALFKKYGDRIVQKKLGDTVYNFYNNNPDDVKSALLKRYAQAVCHRLQLYWDAELKLDMVSDQELRETEGHIPYNQRDLYYIEHGQQGESPVAREQRRAYLNAKLKDIRKSIETQKV